MWLIQKMISYENQNNNFHHNQCSFYFFCFRVLITIDHKTKKNNTKNVELIIIHHFSPVQIIIWKTYLVIVKIKQIHKFFIVKLNWGDKKYML